MEYNYHDRSKNIVKGLNVVLTFVLMAMSVVRFVDAVEDLRK